MECCRACGVRFKSVIDNVSWSCIFHRFKSILTKNHKPQLLSSPILLNKQFDCLTFFVFPDFQMRKTQMKISWLWCNVSKNKRFLFISLSWIAKKSCCGFCTSQGSSGLKGKPNPINTVRDLFAVTLNRRLIWIC